MHEFSKTTNDVLPWKERIKLRKVELRKGKSCNVLCTPTMFVEAKGSNNRLSLRVVNGSFMVCQLKSFGQNMSSMRVGIWQIILALLMLAWKTSPIDYEYHYHYNYKVQWGEITCSSIVCHCPAYRACMIASYSDGHVSHEM